MSFNPNHSHPTGFVPDNPFSSSRPNHQTDEDIYTQQMTTMPFHHAYLEENVSLRGPISVPVDFDNCFGSMVGDNNNTNYFTPQTRLPEQACPQGQAYPQGQVYPQGQEYPQGQASNGFYSPGFFPRFTMDDPGAGPDQVGGMQISAMSSIWSGFQEGYNNQFSAQFNNGTIHGQRVISTGENLQQEFSSHYYAPFTYEERVLSDFFFKQVSIGMQGLNMSSAGPGAYVTLNGGFDRGTPGGFHIPFSAQGLLAQNNFFQPQVNSPAIAPNIPPASGADNNAESSKKSAPYIDSEPQAPNPSSAPDYKCNNDINENPSPFSLPTTPHNQAATNADMTDPCYSARPYGPVNRTGNVFALPSKSLSLLLIPL